MLQTTVPEESHEDAARELAAARRALELEFDAKMRDLKAQHTRRMDRLKEEQAAWEEEKRAQKKLVADKAEQVKRRVENTQQKIDLAGAERKELAELREQVKERERGAREAARLAAANDVRLTSAQRVLRSARTRATVAVLLVGGAGWLAVARPRSLTLAAMGLATLAALVLVLGISREKQTG